MATSARRANAHDRMIVKQFVAFLRANGQPGLHIDRWPEEEKDGDIEAIAGQSAIEHTSIDSVPEQRQRSEWLRRVTGDLRSVSVPRFIIIALSIDAIQPGRDWNILREALRKWFLTDGQRLRDGDYEVTVPGVPMPVFVHQYDPEHVGPGIIFTNYVSKDPAFASRVKRQCDGKIRKLARHKSDNMTTILLLESEDISLMNDSIMASALRHAYPDGKPDGVDQVWYVGTGLRDSFFFRNISNWSDNDETARGVVWKIALSAP